MSRKIGYGISDPTDIFLERIAKELAEANRLKRLEIYAIHLYAYGQVNLNHDPIKDLKDLEDKIE